MVKRKICRRSPEEWQKIISSQSQSNISMLAYCRANNIPPSSLSYWKKRFNKISSVETNTRNNFIKISNFSPQSYQSLKIQTPGGYGIELKENTGLEFLSSILKAISEI